MHIPRVPEELATSERGRVPEYRGMEDKVLDAKIKELMASDQKVSHTTHPHQLPFLHIMLHDHS